MEKDRSTRIIAVMALIVGVVGLSIGFAAFSSNLKITNTTATVTPDKEDFRVLFTDDSDKSAELLTEDGKVFEADLDKIVTEVSDEDNVIASSKVTIDNSSYSTPIISGLSAGFNAPGQSVTYTFFSKNVGDYVAYLKSLTATKADAEGYIVCTPTPENSEEVSESSELLIKNACKTISATVNVYAIAKTDPIATITLAKDTNDSTFATTISESNSLQYKDSQEYHKIEVVIEYGDTAEKVDEPFKVEFGDVILGYSSVN